MINWDKPVEAIGAGVSGSSKAELVFKEWNTPSPVPHYGVRVKLVLDDFLREIFGIKDSSFPHLDMFLVVSSEDGTDVTGQWIIQNIEQ